MHSHSLGFFPKSTHPNHRYHMALIFISSSLADLRWAEYTVSFLVFLLVEHRRMVWTLVIWTIASHTYPLPRPEAQLVLNLRGSSSRARTSFMEKMPAASVPLCSPLPRQSRVEVLLHSKLLWQFAMLSALFDESPLIAWLTGDGRNCLSVLLWPLHHAG